MTLEQLQLENEQLKAENKAYKEDITLLKKELVSVLTVLGIVNEDGSLKEQISFTQLSGFLGKIMLGNKEAIAKLSNVQNLVPLLEKYKNL